MSDMVENHVGDTVLDRSRTIYLNELDRLADRRVFKADTYDFIRRFIERADDERDMKAIMTLSMISRQTGLIYDAELPSETDDIKFLKKNDELSFDDSNEGEDAPKHSLIIGDNHDALLNLRVQYEGKIDVIYIDPPYGANDMGQSAQVSYTNHLYRDSLLSMLHPRLVEAKRLLADTGVIFCSIDDKNQAYVKCLFDEVFGEENFISCMIVASNSSKNNAKFIGDSHEYVLVYAKDISQVLENWSVKKNNVDEFEKRAKQLVTRGLSSDEIHKELLELVKYPRFYDFDHYTFADAKGVYQEDNLGGVSSGCMNFDVMHPITNKPCKMPDGGWRYRKEKLERLLADGYIAFGPDEMSIPRRKRYLSDHLEQTPKSTIFFDSQSSTKWVKRNGFDFPFPKAIDLIKHLLSMYPKKDAIVLDFFAGSGTTGHAVLSLNTDDGGTRTFILVTNDEGGIAREVTTDRMHLVMRGTHYDGRLVQGDEKGRIPYGGSLAVYEMDEVSAREVEIGKCAFDLIDETAYGEPSFSDVKAKAEWVCQNFAHTMNHFTRKQLEAQEKMLRGEEA